MSLSVVLYLIDVAHSLDVFFTIIFIIGMLAMIIAFIVYVATECGAEMSEKMKLNFSLRTKQLVAATLVSGLLACFCPTKQTMYMIVAASTAKDVIDNPKVQALGGKVFDLINKKLDELDAPKK